MGNDCYLLLACIYMTKYQHECSNARELETIDVICVKLVYNSVVRTKRERERENPIPLLNAACTGGTVAGCNFEPLPFIRRHNVCLAVRSYY